MAGQISQSIAWKFYINLNFIGTQLSSIVGLSYVWKRIFCFGHYTTGTWLESQNDSNLSIIWNISWTSNFKNQNCLFVKSWSPHSSLCIVTNWTVHFETGSLEWVGNKWLHLLTAEELIIKQALNMNIIKMVKRISSVEVVLNFVLINLYLITVGYVKLI